MLKKILFLITILLYPSFVFSGEVIPFLINEYRSDSLWKIFIRLYFFYAGSLCIRYGVIHKPRRQPRGRGRG